MMTLTQKYIIPIDRRTKLLNKMRFQFLVLDIQSIPNKIEFPYFLCFKIFGNLFPIIINFLDRIHVWLQNLS